MQTSSIWGLASQNAPVMDSAVDFPTKTRFHIALNVKNVEANLAFYETLFGQKTHTLREGYAKFDLREPPLIFSLNQVPKNAHGNGVFGIQIKEKATLEAMATRVRKSSFKKNVSGKGTAFIVRDPEGNTWQLLPG